MRATIIAFFSIISLNCFTQDIFMINDKSYPSSGAFTFEINAYDFDKELNVLVAKDGDKGILAFSIKTPFEEIIKDKATLYLDDGSVINLIDRKIYDQVDDISTTVFFLTPNEILKLRTIDIVKIRYSTGYFGSDEIKNHSASNTHLVNKLIFKDNEFINADIEETIFTTGFFEHLF